MSDARARFLTRNPFLGVVALGMPWKESPAVRSVTSDGSTLYYNPEFVRHAPPLELEAHLMHVLLHWALGHPWRGAGFDARRWRAATDLALVELFLRSPYDYRPVLPLRYPPETGRDRSAEEIASILPESSPDGDEAGSLRSDLPECWQDPVEGEGLEDRLRQRWRERLVQAAQSTSAGGDGGAFAEETLRALEAPRIDWRGRLSMFLQRSQAADYTWVPPNRRYLHRGVYLPGTRSRSLGDLVVALDTSGSIDPDVARSFLAEVGQIAQLLGSTGRLLLIQADEEVRDVRTIGPGDRVPDTIRGRGGTSFVPVFDYLSHHPEISPGGLLYLTDGQGTFPEKAPPFPVLWVLVAPAHVPFGASLALPGG
ncbi:MAG: VWA-like domain-containing protein [Thermoplasmata archaeon]|nr:VWA-like domain-containing protein [Thermoplasmata archaeon]